VDRIGLVSFDFKNFAGTDFGTIPAAVAFFLVDDRIHIKNFKFQINSKPKCPITKSEAPLPPR
jgi:hypothetical protein